MLPISVNPLSVLAAAIVSMALGFLWYSPLIMGKPWMKLMKMSDKDTGKNKQMGFIFLLSFMGAVLQAWVLAQMVNLTFLIGMQSGALFAVWTWVGFIFPTHLSHHLYSKSGIKWSLMMIDASYHLIAMTAMGAILGWWQ